MKMKRVICFLKHEISLIGQMALLLVGLTVGALMSLVFWGTWEVLTSFPLGLFGGLYQTMSLVGKIFHR